MSDALRQLLRVSAVTLILYAGLSAYVVTSGIPSDNMPGTFRAANIAGRTAGVPPVFVYGASNAIDLFIAPELGRRLGASAFNLAFGGATMISMLRTTADTLAALPPEDRAKTVIVFGLWYGAFGDRSEPGPQSALARPLGAVYSYVKYLETWLWRAFHNTFLGLASRRPELMFDWYTDHTDLGDIEQRRRNLKARQPAFFADRFKRLDPVQFEAMVEAARTVTAAGARLVIVDLPMASWHTSKSTLYQDYQVEKRGYLNRIQKQFGDRVAYLDLQGTMSDQDFYDIAHVDTPAGRRFTSMFVERLRALATPGQ